MIGTCSFTPTAADVGKTISYDCGELFELIPGIPVADTSVDVYPYVLRNGILLEHNGNANKLTLAIVDDDAFEPNDTSLVATPLTVALGAPATWTDLVSQDMDVFKFVAPAGVASVEVVIEFWTGANDLDLYLDDDIPLGPGDSDKAIISVTPGQTYYFQVQGAFAFSPAFYDLRLTAYDTDHEISVTTPPKGTPDPVAGGGQVSFSLEASDTLQHALGYFWTARCTWSVTAGQWANRDTDSPTWTAPANLTGTQQTCRITVTAGDEFGLSWSSSVLEQRVGPTPHTLTITAGPSGTPNPSSPSSAVVLSVTAADSYGDALSYAWQASCPGLSENGTFSPSAVVQNPTWTAPANATGSEQTCTVSVTAIDGQGLSANGSFTQTVGLPPVTATPTTSPRARPSAASSRPASPCSTPTRADARHGRVPAEGHHDRAHARPDARRPGAHHLDVATLGTSTRPSRARLGRVLHGRPLRPAAGRRPHHDLGHPGYGSHAETSIDAPASTWYLAEGATIGNFELYYLIQNPNPTPLDRWVTYLLPPPAAPLVRTYPMGANTRTNIAVHPSRASRTSRCRPSSARPPTSRSSSSARCT